jgi:hypothetical protein
MARQPNPSRTKTESTTAGEQHVIPGAEKISGAEVAKRKARQPLKPQVAQKPADHGLFSDASKQIDFIDDPVAPPQVESTRLRPRITRLQPASRIDTPPTPAPRLVPPTGSPQAR